MTNIKVEVVITEKLAKRLKKGIVTEISLFLSVIQDPTTGVNYLSIDYAGV